MLISTYLYINSQIFRKQTTDFSMDFSQPISCLIFRMSMLYKVGQRSLRREGSQILSLGGDDPSLGGNE